MMTISEIQSYVDVIEKNSSLCEEKKFDQRMEVVDFIEFHVSDQIQALRRNMDHSKELVFLQDRIEKIVSGLLAINVELFQKLRSTLRIAKDKKKEFNHQINDYIDYQQNSPERKEEMGYDNLDTFINGLLGFETMPVQTIDLETEMVYYQKTPARLIFELVEKSHFKKGDVFIDIGSGLGQVAILVNLLTGITTQGIEFEPSFCDFARNCTTDLNLSGVTFINVDARKASYRDGNIFFMFTPFRGEIMREVLEKLRIQSLTRKIKIITYGPCTSQVYLQEWLTLSSPKKENIYELGIFKS